MKIYAASRLVRAAKADEEMARKYIEHYTGVSSSDLAYVDRFGKEDRISFTLKTSENFGKAVKNLTHHFGVPKDMSTYNNPTYVWHLDDDRAILLSSFDLYHNRYKITIQDSWPLTLMEQRRRKALDQMKTRPIEPEPAPTNNNHNWRTTIRRPR